MIAFAIKDNEGTSASVSPLIPNILLEDSVHVINDGKRRLKA